MHPDIIHYRYYKIYIQLISKAQTDVPSGYTEKHHILPRSMGGSNDPSNLVKLSPKQHYVAHHLLYRCTKGESFFKMSFAWYYMLRNRGETSKHRYTNSRGYAQSKEAHAKALSAINKGRNVGIKSPAYDHTVYKFYDVNNNLFIYCTKHHLYTNYHIGSSEVARIMSNPSLMSKGMMWCPDENHIPTPHTSTGLNNPSADPNQYTFVHPQYGRFVGTRIELSEVFADLNMTKAGLCDLIKKRTKSHRGWSLELNAT